MVSHEDSIESRDHDPSELWLIVHLGGRIFPLSARDETSCETTPRAELRFRNKHPKSEKSCPAAGRSTTTHYWGENSYSKISVFSSKMWDVVDRPDAVQDFSNFGRFTNNRSSGAEVTLNADLHVQNLKNSCPAAGRSTTTQWDHFFANETPSWVRLRPLTFLSAISRWCSIIVPDQEIMILDDNVGRLNPSLSCNNLLYWERDRYVQSCWPFLHSMSPEN